MRGSGDWKGAATRPRTVTTIAVLAIAAGVIAVIMAFALVMAAAVPRSAEDKARIDVDMLLALAAWCSIGGLLQLVGGILAFRGASWGRALLTAVLALHVVLTLVLAARSHDQTPTAVFVAIFTVIGLVLLWTRRANSWFTRRETAGAA